MQPRRKFLERISLAGKYEAEYAISKVLLSAAFILSVDSSDTFGGDGLDDLSSVMDSLDSKKACSAVIP
jgi:hypothetical protein